MQALFEDEHDAELAEAQRDDKPSALYFDDIRDFQSWSTTRVQQLHETLDAFNKDKKKSDQGLSLTDYQVNELKKIAGQLFVPLGYAMGKQNKTYGLPVTRGQMLTYNPNVEDQSRGTLLGFWFRSVGTQEKPTFAESATRKIVTEIDDDGITYYTYTALEQGSTTIWACFLARYAQMLVENGQFVTHQDNADLWKMESLYKQIEMNKGDGFRDTVTDSRSNSDFKRIRGVNKKLVIEPQKMRSLAVHKLGSREKQLSKFEAFAHLATSTMEGAANLDASFFEQKEFAQLLPPRIVLYPMQKQQQEQEQKKQKQQQQKQQQQKQQQNCQANFSKLLATFLNF